MAPVVIIGTGLAGYGVAREFRKRDKETALVLITRDSGAFYSKPTLSNALALGLEPSGIPLNTAQQMATRLNASIVTRREMRGVDCSRNVVVTDDDSIRYSRLVLALGADQLRVDIKGDGASAVVRVNDLDDYAHLREALQGKRRVVIIGAGLIGCEFANDMVAASFSVHVVDIAALPLSRFLPPLVASFFQSRLGAAGVTWHLGASVENVARTTQGLEVSLSNSENIRADVVVSAVGLKPRTSLAAAAGLATATGIVTNRYLEASAENIFALGDCSEIEGYVLPYVMPIGHAARAVAATLAGKRTSVTLPAMPVTVKTPACPTIVAPPPKGLEGRWHVETTDNGMKAVFLDGKGDLAGFALCGDATGDRPRLEHRLPAVLQ